MSGGNKLNYSKHLTIRPKPNEAVRRPEGVNFGDFVRNNWNFLAIRHKRIADSNKNIKRMRQINPVLNFWIFCFKTKDLDKKKSHKYYVQTVLKAYNLVFIVKTLVPFVVKPPTSHSRYSLCVRREKLSVLRG